MSAPPRQRLFGAKPVGVPSLATTQPVTPAELHHNGGKLFLGAVISVSFVAASLWAIVAGDFSADYHGRDALLVHFLGPQGMILLFALCGVCCALLAAAYARLLVSGDRLAARATFDGLAINGAWGRKFYVWRDIIAVRLHITKTLSREIVFIKIERLGGGSQMISSSTVEGGRAEVETWVQRVQSFLHR